MWWSAGVLQLHDNNRNDLFHWTGKYIAEPWGQHLLSQSRILERELLKEFITGESYDHFGIHQILATAAAAAAAAVEILHFMEFDSRFNNESLRVITDELKLMKEVKEIDFKCFLQEATEVLGVYLLLSRDTSEVKRGLTAQC